jgi:diguanylate cyclase (GGDEF)-like protein
MHSRGNFWSKIRQRLFGTYDAGLSLTTLPPFGREKTVPTRILSCGFPAESAGLVEAALSETGDSAIVTDLPSSVEEDTLFEAAAQHDLLILGSRHFPERLPFLVRDMTTEYPSLPIVVIAPDDESATAGQCLAEGAMTYLLTSELTAPMLREAVEEAFREKSLELDVCEAADESPATRCRDPLTGLPDSELARDFFDSEFHSAARRDTDISCLVIRISRMDELVEVHGPVFSDLVVRNTADLLSRAVRHADVLARIERAEFILVLPGASTAQATQRARQILTLLAGHGASFFPPATDVGIRIGIASRMESPAGSAEELAEFARVALRQEAAEGNQAGISLWLP